MSAVQIGSAPATFFEEYPRFSCFAVGWDCVCHCPRIRDKGCYRNRCEMNVHREKSKGPLGPDGPSGSSQIQTAWRDLGNPTTSLSSRGGGNHYPEAPAKIGRVLESLISWRLEGLFFNAFSRSPKVTSEFYHDLRLSAGSTPKPFISPAFCSCAVCR